MTYKNGKPSYDAPCSCGANQWKRVGYSDTNLIWGYQCLSCGRVADCE